MDDHSNDPQLTEYAVPTGEETDISQGFAYDQHPSDSPKFPTALYGHHAEIGPSTEDTQMLIHDGGYNSSDSSTHHSGHALNGDLDEDLRHQRSRASSRSSVSSIPASVLTNMADGMKTAIHDNMLSHNWQDHDIKAHSKLDGHLRSMRHREAAFRKPSSVKAMQMHTEDEGDDDFLTPPKRRGGQRFSDISIRSAGSSPLRKFHHYSPSGSAGKPKVKKEYPLVLLHCNLLPPSLPVPGAMGYHNQKILQEVLPPEYWRRWKLLEEKVGSGVLRERGVLISHPEDLYDLLEERLLESLELQRPRLDHGHFLGHDENDSEGDDQSLRESATDEEEGEECPDCGGHVVRHNNEGRKWEIKVFAANGLMRAGAWAAAWKEMEKVDVEVGLWLPSEIRRELERRLLEQEMDHFENRLQVPHFQAPEHEMSAEVRRPSLHGRTPSSAIEEPSPFVPEKIEAAAATEKEAAPEQQMPVPQYVPRSSDDIDLQTLLVNYVRVLASDRRNVAIAVLSFLVLFLAVNSGPQANQSALRPFPQDILEAASASTSIMSPMHSSSARWDKPTSCASSSIETQHIGGISSITSSSREILQSATTPLGSVVIASAEIPKPESDDPPTPQAEPEASSSVENPLAIRVIEPVTPMRLKPMENPGTEAPLDRPEPIQPVSPAMEVAIHANQEADD
ncbi:hypothetical protein CBS147321_6551 [Aspergillus niger]|uniref:uncharacterized protein n=1 Tax=Aspergillus lacticoffeatus (strain CBS 101883) TaxID=1450533 RepID=UPI000D800C97|nr:uncharacterized protein BO96DRAFT_391688 [Aspergillus niger CBS 101883]KAI2922934.1 hypothetical protein CBS147320_7165 [Aspergillus niger]KAI2939865.1 hypothetical protein CBS147321_6551 [Aspergillus niger]KAI2950993.1 hypothetical protein CBS147322_5230 [Aspergillus niger]KAI2974056.1 hypothetical protein CBS147324_3780 [Aspergillus niger]KAI3056698.1 hypothetical protein CBS147352_2224 [Aspergillus niger]